MRRSSDVKQTANKQWKAGTTPRRAKDLQTSTQGSITVCTHTKTHFLHLLRRLISCAQRYFPASRCVQELIRVVIYDWPWIMALWAQLDWPERRDAGGVWRKDKWVKRGKAGQRERDEGGHKSIRLLLYRSLALLSLAKADLRPANSTHPPLLRQGWLCQRSPYRWQTDLKRGINRM